MHEISHKWVDQVLRQRGIPSPGALPIEHGLKQADTTTIATIYRSLRQIEQGSETDSALEEVTALVNEWALRYKQQSECAAPLLAKQHVSVKPETIARDSAHHVAATYQRQTHHIYGNSAALCIELDVLRGRLADQQPTFTISIDAARAYATRKYDWKTKVQFQIMRRELPLVACALMGMLNSPLTLGNHGPDSDKTLHIADQGAHVFVKVSQGNSSYPVPVEPSDVHRWAEITFLAIRLNATELSESLQVALLQRVANMFNAKQAKHK